MSGMVEAIAISARAEGSMELHEVVTATAGHGLQGDRYAEGAGTFSDTPGGGRDLTLIEAEALDQLLAERGVRLATDEHRRNVTTRGIDLNALVGKRFLVGEVLCEGVRLCEPCDHLEGVTGKPVMRALVHRAGLRAEVLTDGIIRIGDVVMEATAAVAAD